MVPTALKGDNDIRGLRSMIVETTHSAAIGNWKELYRAALFEANAGKQAERIAEAEKLVVARARVVSCERR
jgi:hypothetical protein